MNVLLMLLMGCNDDVSDPDGHDHDHDHGVIAAVQLTFAPTSGGDAVIYEMHDGVSDEVQLMAGESYDLSVAVLEEDADGLLDLTGEISNDAESHQVFFLGDDIASEATQSQNALVSVDYNDSDSNGMPLGIDSVATGLQAGSGSMQVVLRHMPPENGSPIKNADSAADVASGGLSAIGGDNDFDVSFDLTVIE
jgi:hypothetical protein